MVTSTISATTPRIPQRLPEASPAEERAETPAQDALEASESSASAPRPQASLPAYLGRNVNQTA